MKTYLTERAHFTNKEEMDNAADKHVLTNWNAMNRTDRAVLDMIRRYSVKYGAAHLKHETIEKAINKSNATVRRAIRKLEALQIIERIPFIRPVMSGLGANIYVIKSSIDQSNMNSPEVVEKPSDSKAQPVNNETEAFLSKSLSAKDLKRTSPAEILPTTLFGKMKSLLSSTIGESKLARNVYGVYRHQSMQMLKFSIHEDKGQLFEHLALQALRIAVQATKNKTIINLPGYYADVFSALIEKALFSDAFKEYDCSVEGFYC